MDSREARSEAKIQEVDIRLDELRERIELENNKQLRTDPFFIRLHYILVCHFEDEQPGERLEEVRAFILSEAIKSRERAESVVQDPLLFPLLKSDIAKSLLDVVKSKEIPTEASVKKEFFLELSAFTFPTNVHWFIRELRQHCKYNISYGLIRSTIVQNAFVHQSIKTLVFNTPRISDVFRKFLTRADLRNIECAEEYQLGIAHDLFSVLPTIPSPVAFIDPLKEKLLKLTTSKSSKHIFAYYMKISNFVYLQALENKHVRDLILSPKFGSYFEGFVPPFELRALRYIANRERQIMHGYFKLPRPSAVPNSSENTLKKSPMGPS